MRRGRSRPVLPKNRLCVEYWSELPGLSKMATGSPSNSVSDSLVSLPGVLTVESVIPTPVTIPEPTSAVHREVPLHGRALQVRRSTAGLSAVPGLSVL